MSSVSNCSEYVDHYCQRRCNNLFRRERCELVNDRTYTILRKICRKIFNEYKRSECREKYTIFDGGNSINVRIHRSGSKSNENNRYEKSFKKDNYQVEDRQFGRYNKRPEKDGEKFAFDSYRGKSPPVDDEINYVNTKGSKGKKDRERVTDDSILINRNLKGKNKKGREVDDYDGDEVVYKETEKAKGKFSQRIAKKGYFDGDRDSNGNTIANRKSKKHHIQNFNTNKERYRNTSMRGLKDANETFDNDAYGKRSGKQGETKGRIIKKGDKYLNEHELVHDVISTTKFRKVKNKYKKNFDEVKSDDKEDFNKGKYRKNNKVHKYDVDKDKSIRNTKKLKSFYNNDEIVKTNDRKNIKFRKTQGFDDVINNGILLKERNHHVIKNLGYNVRRGETVGLMSNNKMKKLEISINQKSESIGNRQNKASRADEVKACDYLRAYMEQRELCSQLYCPLKCSQLSPRVCIPQTCIPTCCQNTAISFFSKICKC